MTVKSDEYRCEAYVILSFHRAVRFPPPGFSRGEETASSLTRTYRHYARNGGILEV